VLYPFGHGLSYTTFAYRDLVVDQPVVDADQGLKVRVKVQNTGEIAGQEVVQLYVRDVESTAFRPDKELKGFAKAALQPGQEAEVTIELDRRAFATYDPGLGDWHVEPGAFELLVGASSRDIRLRATVTVESDDPPATAVDREALAAYYHLSKDKAISQADFERLLGRKVPGNEIVRGEPYTRNTPISDMQGSYFGRQLGAYVQRQIKARIVYEDDPNAPMIMATAWEGPLRILMMGSDGAINREMLEALVLLVNGRYLKGVSGLLGARRSRKH
jgi:beta-glucosidase